MALIGIAQRNYSKTVLRFRQLSGDVVTASVALTKLSCIVPGGAGDVDLVDAVSVLHVREAAARVLPSRSPEAIIQFFRPDIDDADGLEVQNVEEFPFVVSNEATVHGRISVDKMTFLLLDCISPFDTGTDSAAHFVVTVEASPNFPGLLPVGRLFDLNAETGEEEVRQATYDLETDELRRAVFDVGTLFERVVADFATVQGEPERACEDRRSRSRSRGVQGEPEHATVDFISDDRYEGMKEDETYRGIERKWSGYFFHNRTETIGDPKYLSRILQQNECLADSPDYGDEDAVDEFFLDFPLRFVFWIVQEEFFRRDYSGAMIGADTLPAISELTSTVSLSIDPPPAAPPLPFGRFLVEQSWMQQCVMELGKRPFATNIRAAMSPLSWALGDFEKDRQKASYLECLRFFLHWLATFLQFWEEKSIEFARQAATGEGTITEEDAIAFAEQFVLPVVGSRLEKLPSCSVFVKFGSIGSTPATAEELAQLHLPWRSPFVRYLESWSEEPSCSKWRKAMLHTLRLVVTHSGFGSYWDGYYTIGFGDGNSI